MTTIDPARFRQVLGHYPTGVVIVTAIEDGQPVGATMGSFTSVSLDPPLVGFLPQQTSGTWQAIARAGRFCVNVLGAHQGDLCWRFARPSEEDRFADLVWTDSPAGSPIIEGVLAWIDCTIASVTEAGDHLFVLGSVVELAIGEHEDPSPLLFFKGKLGRFDLI